MENNNFWENKKVFVTGGTGFIGTYLVKELIDNGAEVFCLTQELVGNSNFTMLGLDKKTTLIFGSVLDYNLISTTLKKHEIDTVFHLAAQPLVQVAFERPYETIQTNFIGTLNILEASRMGEIKRIIIASSDKAYGDHKDLPYEESFALQGRYPYDVSKSCADLLAQGYGKTYSLPVVVTRFSNVYGGGDLNFDRIVPQTIRHLINKEPILIRSNGKFKREFFYVKDASQAYLKLAEKIEILGLKGEAFNFGTDAPVLIMDLVKKIKDIYGNMSAEVKILDKVKAEIRDQFLSSKKARDMLEWEPKYDLESGIRETCKWYGEYFLKKPMVKDINF
ncbi:MAG: GDP-mannose 4,6-dehydratase [Candidatus Pacearchaeota archaeon]|nr:GDP-mannose 4,6-dehydratase [Candidatus Pacearchaeota archaeon]